MKLLDYVIFAQLLSYVRTVAALFVMRSRSPDAPVSTAHGVTRSSPRFTSATLSP
jgi:hypothetical protein